MKTPLEHYQVGLKTGTIEPNRDQEAIVIELNHLFNALLKQKGFFAGWQRKIARYFGERTKGIKGIYLWGDVGRGKTFLMDLFYHALPFAEKKRFHFHRFMQNVHQALHQKRGSRDPLKEIAREFAKEMDVLCFDEFYVEDIADAMILGELFKYLFLQGVTLVATSNIMPSNLYANGLQRDKFLPAIALIEAHTKILALNHTKDYRLQYLQTHKLYHYPLNSHSAEQMEAAFARLTLSSSVSPKVLTIVNRPIPTIQCADSIVWFSFETLCETARSAADYIEIARSFHVVLLSSVKKMGREKEAPTRRFMALVDEFYERHVTLIISAEDSFHDLYTGQRYQKEFQRTISRLTEMQSTDYLAKPHLG